jgi:restriction system protein
MPVPDFQTLMLPVLEVFADGEDHTSREVRDRVAEKLRISDADLAELLPSGTQPAFHNRIHWALWYLQRCGLTQRPRRGVHRITERGCEVLTKKPARIDLKFLAQFPEFRALKKVRSSESSSESADADPLRVPIGGATLETPDALLARAYAEHREALEDDILERLLNVSPRRFESIVIELLVAMGYGGSFADAAQRIGRSGDGGIDGIIKEDRLGLDAVYVQAKRWQGNVGRPEIQKFAGSLQGVRAKKGIFITTSDFSRDAVDYAERIETRIVLVDGSTLARYLFEFGVGVRDEHLYAVKRLDEDFFEDD